MKSPSQNLLIVDDDCVLTQVLARAFSRRGYCVLQAQNSVQALAHGDTHTIDLCILDLKLSEESGLPLIQPLKQKYPHIKILMLTGYSSINTAVEAIKLGATNYLCKPADADEILQALNQQDGNPQADIQPSPPSVNRLEWEHIQRILADNNGNISATARALGMHRRTLQRKLLKRPVKQ